MKEGYTSLSKAIEALQDEGFNIDFNLVEDGITSKHLKKEWKAGDLEVVKHYRFEGDSNPADNSILYAIKTHDNEKGLLVDNYGARDSYISKDMLEKLKVDSEKEQGE